MSDFKHTWKELLTTIKPKVSDANYKKWIRPIKFLDSEENNLKLGAPNIFVKEWIQKYYQELILQELYTLTQKNFDVTFEITGDEKIIEVPEDLQEKSQAEQTGPLKRKVPQANNLNPKYTFPKFVVGSSNQFAHAAAMAAGELPGGHYNPLFIYGGVGLGKTHLLNAVGLKVAENHPEMKILYMSAEQFMNELIFCIRFEKMDRFRNKYRDACDVLLIDDIQFMIGKERTQEEFFHTFNTLYESQRQIVVTSDKLPKDLNGLEERLRSRFEWGLIADIQPPDLETRVAILKKKADINGVCLGDDVAMFLASQIKSNVRELEGSLIRLSAFASLNGVPITISLAKEVLQNIIRERAADCSIEAIQRTVADFYHIKVSDLKSSRRLKSVSAPRQVAMYLCKEHLNASYPEIGYKFGGKDHSTVIHAVKKIRSLLEKDETVKNDIELIEKTLLQ